MLLNCPEGFWEENDNCVSCSIDCKRCDSKLKSCVYCEDGKFVVRGIGCSSCHLGNGCLKCDKKTGDCVECPDGKFVFETGCSNTKPIIQEPPGITRKILKYFGMVLGISIVVAIVIWVFCLIILTKYASKLH